MNVVKDKTSWNNIIKEEFSNYNDIYFKYEYLELYKRHYDAGPESIFWKDKNVKIFWTHLVRDISKIKQFKDFRYYDLTAPYGYGGPLIITKTESKEKINESLKEFLEEYKNYALKNNYVCEFIRFHPIFENWKFFNKILDVEYTNDVVVVDLTKDLKEIWKGIKKGHKYNIKKSLKASCKIKSITNPFKKDIDTFINIYNHAMDRNKAEKKYYFSMEFINDQFNLLNAILIEVIYKDSVIGTSLFIYGDKIVHYHLSGASYDFKGVYPTDLILWEAIKWAKKNNFKYLHLGGGRGVNDSLFKFKRGFSDIIKQFNIGKLIFDANIYNKLSRMNSCKSDDYFPKYRQGFDKNII